MISRARLAVAGIASLLALEGGLRVVAATGSGHVASLLRAWDPEASSLELLGESCFRARPGASFRFPNGTGTTANRMGFRGPEVEVPKPPGTFRVLLLGGSSSHGFLVGDEGTIDAHLRDLLADAGAGAGRIEVVNLGFDALDALCEQERVRSEGSALEPDAVILHTGINDVPALRFPALPANDPERGARAVVRRAEEARRRPGGVWRHVKHRLLLARLPGVLRALVTHRARLDGPAEPVPPALDAFEHTVRATIALLPPGVAVLLSTPPSGLATPAATAATASPLVVDAATTQRYRDRLDTRLRRIADDLGAGGRPVRYVPHAVPDTAFLDDCHLSDAGNRLLAHDFLQALGAARDPDSGLSRVRAPSPAARSDAGSPDAAGSGSRTPGGRHR